MKIALAGNPNSGKTTFYNAITGSDEHVGNWHGVTVDSKKSPLLSTLNSSDENVEIIDLPGAYSMNPFTKEESITSDFVKNENPDVIINIVESTNLSRSLFFTTQLLELGIPVVIALNKTDLVEAKGNAINVTELNQALNCPIVQTTAAQNNNLGVQRTINEAIRLVNGRVVQKAPLIDGLKVAKNERQYQAADRCRYVFVNELIEVVERKKISPSEQTRQDSVDRIVANKWLGIPIFILVMFGIFYISQSWLGPIVADYLVALLEGFQGWVGELLTDVNPFVSALLVDGIIGGVIAVIGFLPLIMIMFFLMSLLEDCGYMARVAVVMDRYFRKIGLSGKSIIPMIIGTACGIPGVMASRTIRNERQRRTTAMLTPFMPCGAKMPVIALFAGVFFSGSALVAVSMYFLGILVIVFSALIIRKITGDTSVQYFIMELPEYRFPSIKRAFYSMFRRAKAFILKATTIILLCNAAVQIMQSFTWQLTLAQDASDSILASISHPFAILFIPLGFGMWQFASASVVGFIAKENVVGTLAVVFGISNFIDTDALELVSGSAQSVESAMGITAVVALSFLVFNLFTPPCFACIGAVRAEVNSSKWLWGAIGFQFSIGYTLAFLVYQIGTLITQQTFGSGFIPGLIVVLLIWSYIGHLMNRGSKTREE